MQSSADLRGRYPRLDEEHPTGENKANKLAEKCHPSRAGGERNESFVSIKITKKTNLSLWKSYRYYIHLKRSSLTVRPKMCRASRVRNEDIKLKVSSQHQLQTDKSEQLNHQHN